MRCLRLHPEMRPITIRGHAGPAYVPVEGGGGVADYLVIDGEVAWSVDAKSTTAARWSLDNLHPSQAAAFDQWTGAHTSSDAGFGAGLVIALHGSAADVWWVPWSALRTRWWAYHRSPGTAQRGTASLSAADLDLLGRACPGGDWLPAARDLYHRSTP